MRGYGPIMKDPKHKKSSVHYIVQQIPYIRVGVSGCDSLFTLNTKVFEVSSNQMRVLQWYVKGNILDPPEKGLGVL